MNLKAIKMPGKKLIPVAALMLLATGCANEPSVTNNELVPTPKGNYGVVSICYAASAATREQIIALAREHCSPERQTLEVWQHDTFVNDCPLAKKNRVSFICRP